MKKEENKDKRDLPRILLATSIAIWDVKWKMEELEKKDVETYKELNKELCVLKGVYNLIHPYIQEKIEGLMKYALDGKFWTSNEDFTYYSYYELTDEEMKKIGKYLGLKYYYQIFDGIWDATWTNDEEEGEEGSYCLVNGKQKKKEKSDI